MFFEEFLGVFAVGPEGFAGVVFVYVMFVDVGHLEDLIVEEFFVGGVAHLVDEVGGPFDEGGGAFDEGAEEVADVVGGMDGFSWFEGGEGEGRGEFVGGQVGEFVLQVRFGAEVVVKVGEGGGAVEEEREEETEVVAVMLGMVFLHNWFLFDTRKS
mmetsp:Transcript_17142/g.35872  ORF Transcript_17142/g.35872 Transcript_17142/m.35872 type:complete len:156 (+) Transcript_17142:1881-2348(+)